MNPLKQFMCLFRQADLSEPNVFLYKNITNELYDYVHAFDYVKFEDGHYESYCGEIKNIINHFITFWTDVINECVKIADSWRSSMDKKGILALLDQTLETQRMKQQKLEECFLPIESEEEQRIYDEIAALYALRVQDYHAMRDKAILYDKQQDITDFVEVNFEISIRKKNEFLSIAHSWVAEQLAKRTYRIRASFEEIIQRVRGNLDRLRAEYDGKLSTYLDDLYDANKEKMFVSRQDKHRTTDTAEVEWAITKIRERIEKHGIDIPLAHLQEELDYWTNRLREFSEVEKAILQIRNELENVTEYLKQYESLKCMEYPGAKKTCWENMGENFRRRKAYLEKTYLEAAKALMTFFAVKGQNRIYYKDHIGKYAIDDYGHQIYIEDSGKIANHITCDGSRVQYNELGKYYYDRYGRYIIDEVTHERIYQRASCGSVYKLDDSELFVKTTKDCGHSDTPNPSCKMQIRNPNLVELLPKCDPVDIKKSLTPEVVNYLWNSLGHLLPEALNDVGLKKPRNPIYALGQQLMQLKYHKATFSQLAQKKKEADAFRKKIDKERKESAIKAYKEWKGKQVKRRKPEESDDTDLKMAFHDYLTNLYAVNTYASHYY